ncbi:MAG: hypothetical protein AAF363_18685 [Bacteroidota bacterium]
MKEYSNTLLGFIDATFLLIPWIEDIDAVLQGISLLAGLVLTIYLVRQSMKTIQCKEEDLKKKKIERLMKQAEYEDFLAKNKLNK